MYPRMIKKNISYKKHAPQARFFVKQIFLWNKMRRRQDLLNRVCYRPNVLIKFSRVLCPVNAAVQYVICFPRITAQNLLLLIN